MKPPTRLPRPLHSLSRTPCLLRPSRPLLLQRCSPIRAPPAPLARAAIPTSTRTFSTSGRLSNASTAVPLSTVADITSFPQVSKAITSKLLVEPPKVPSEADVLEALQVLRKHAQHRIAAGPHVPTRDPTDELLSLDESSAPTSNSPSSAASTVPSKKRASVVRKVSSGGPSAPKAGDFDDVSELAWGLLSYPGVFITPAVLSAYVSLQSLVREATPLPGAFHLYATKPILSPTHPEKEPRIPDPRQARYAISLPIAKAALDAAIDTRNMVAALDVIDTSFAAPAFRRLKMVTRFLPFAGLVAMTPVGVYHGARWLTTFQDVVDPDVAFGYAFAGLAAYTGFTGIIGGLAYLTWSDKFIRVTWERGTPLRERWFREEERAALDKVAMAWGFEDENRRGFEEGKEWALLKEVIERKGMQLDDPRLMKGMK